MKNLLKALAIAAACLVNGFPAPAQEPVDSHTTIRSESRLVLVDSVVTDKKGNYIRGLTQKDFKVWEDGKEQPISSFTFQSDADPANAQKHYLVLFFDNSSATPASQIYARQAATKFIETNAGPNKLMSIVEFGGSLRITQNFTDDVDRLKKVANGVKFANTSTDSASGALSRGFTNYSTRSVLGALRNMAKGLAQVPGRKTLVFLSAGFRVPAENTSELTAAIDACNHANVAIYPIDVRGLVGPSVGPLGPLGLLHAPQTILLDAAQIASSLALQGRGGGGGIAPGGGGTTGGNSGGVRAPSPTPVNPTPTNPNSGAGSGRNTAPTNPNSGNNTRGNPVINNTNGGGIDNSQFNRQNAANQNRLRALMPNIEHDIGGPESVLYSLASGTGGFVIVNTNDLLGGLEKIGKEQNEYYILGYVPTKELEPGACHTIKLKVDRGGATARYRTGYCDAKTQDVLSGTPTQRELEARLTAGATPTIKASMQAPFFYISPNTARVSATLDIPGDALTFTKEKGKFQMNMNVIGIAYLPNGGVGARFSDNVKLVLDDKKQVEAFTEKPFHYEKQFEMASGTYALKVVFSTAANAFGQLELPVTIEPWEPAKFFLSGLALSKSARPANAAGVGFDAELLEDLVPLLVNGVRITPTGAKSFHKSETGFIYAELYEPALTVPDQKEYPAMGVQMLLLDGKTGKLSKDYGVIRLSAPGQPGNPAVPFGLRIPLAELAAGSYQLQVNALDATGGQYARTIGFEVEN